MSFLFDKYSISNSIQWWYTSELIELILFTSQNCLRTSPLHFLQINSSVPRMTLSFFLIATKVALISQWPGYRNSLNQPFSCFEIQNRLSKQTSSINFNGFLFPNNVELVFPAPGFASRWLADLTHLLRNALRFVTSYVIQTIFTALAPTLWWRHRSISGVFRRRAERVLKCPPSLPEEVDGRGVSFMTKNRSIF